MRIRRYAFVCGGLIAIVGLASWLVFQYESNDEIVRQARRELRNGNAEAALKIVQDLLKNDPDAAAAARVEAMAYAELGEYTKAAELWIALNDSAAARDLYFTASQRSFSSGQWSESADLLRKCLKLFPDDFASHRQLATILNASAQRGDARKHGKVCIGNLQFSITELLLFGKACFQLGQVLTQLNSGPDAERFLRRAEQLAELHRIMRPVYFEGPKPQSFLQITGLMESLGREEEALAWYFATTRFRSPGQRRSGDARAGRTGKLGRQPPGPDFWRHFSDVQ